MAKTVRKKKKTTRKRKVARKSKARSVKKVDLNANRKRPEAPQIDLDTAERGSEVEMKGSRLVVRLSKESHPEIFDLDRLVKQVRKVIESYQRKRKTRDVVSFLQETEKGLKIILRNHLEDAMRKYLA